MVATTVVVSGAGGKMGREVVRAVHGANDMTLVGAVDPMAAGEDAGIVAGLNELDLKIQSSIKSAVNALEEKPVVVDFTTPDAVFDNVMEALELGCRVVFGTTGLSDEQLSQIDRKAKDQGLGVIHAPNFALGAVLMMRFAAEASRFFDGVEVIEYHHDQKKDAPSGTAIKTAEMIREARGQAPSSKGQDEIELVEGARGGTVRDVRVHSVRMPGMVAHQEVILGLPGQTLTIRHDSIDRVSFMPGVLLAVRKVGEIDGLVYGLEHLLFDSQS